MPSNSRHKTFNLYALQHSKLACYSADLICRCMKDTAYDAEFFLLQGQAKPP